MFTDNQKLIDKNQIFDNYLVEIFYQDSNALLCRNYYNETNLIFNNIPKTGKTFAIVSAVKNHQLYAEKIALENGLVKNINLKKIRNMNEFYDMFR